MADKQSREEVVNKAKEIGKQTEESGKQIGKSLKELTVKISVDVDVTDAITGLKAVQREAKEATKALREMEAEAENGEYKPVRARDFLDSDLRGVKLADALYERVEGDVNGMLALRGRLNYALGGERE